MTLPVVTVDVAFTTDPAASPAWTTVPYAKGFTLRRGRSAEGDKFLAGRATVLLANEDRRFDPSYTASPYYPNVVPMRRVRVRADWDAPSHLDLPGVPGAYASTPDSVALSITGAIDVRAMVALDDWSPGTTQALVAKYGTSGNRSWRFFVDTVGSLRITLSQDGAAASSPSGSSINLSATPPGGWVGARFTWDPATSIVRYYTAPFTNDPNAAVWTQLGIDRTETLGFSSLHDNTQPVEIGARQTGTVEPLAGNVAWAEIRNGIDGTVVAAPDFAAGNGNVYTATTLTDPQGNVWTRQGSATFATVATTYDVFNGYVDGWEQNYEHPKVATCVLTATDAFKVLANIDLASSTYAVEVAADTPTAWWRLGDPAGATVALDAVGTAHLTITGEAPTFGAAGLVVRDSDTAVSMVGDSLALMKAPTETLPPTGAFMVEMILKTTGPAGNWTLAYHDDPSNTLPGRIGLVMGNTGVVGFTLTTAGVTQWVESSVSVDDNNPHHVAFGRLADGTMKIYVDGVDVTVVVGGTAGLTTITLASVPLVFGATFGGTLDELATYASALSAVRLLAHSQARAVAWSGELSGARINRLLDAGGWPAADRQIDTGLAVLQGADLGGSALAALQKVEETEQGRLFVTADGKVRFISRDNLLKTPYTESQATYGDTGSELEYEELVYRYDDQTIYNEAHVSRTGGAVAVVSDTTSQDRYMRRVKTIDGLLHVSDATSIDLANWVVAHYKDPLLRVTDLALHPAVNEVTHFPQVLGTELAERVTVRRTPQCLGAAIDQAVHVEGVEHQVTATDWVTKWNLSPAETQAYWIAGVVGSSEAGVSSRAGF